jgi:hypothetical protein
VTTALDAAPGSSASPRGTAATASQRALALALAPFAVVTLLFFRAEPS